MILAPFSNRTCLDECVNPSCSRNLSHRNKRLSPFPFFFFLYPSPPFFFLSLTVYSSSPHPLSLSLTLSLPYLMSLPRLEGRPASSVYLPLATLSPRENWSPTEEEGSEEEERPVKGNTPSTYQYTALICACLIGTGSHFANHTIGPLKPYLKEVF